MATKNDLSDSFLIKGAGAVFSWGVEGNNSKELFWSDPKILGVVGNISSSNLVLKLGVGGNTGANKL